MRAHQGKIGAFSSFAWMICSVATPRCRRDDSFFNSVADPDWRFRKARFRSGHFFFSHPTLSIHVGVEQFPSSRAFRLLTLPPLRSAEQDARANVGAVTSRARHEPRQPRRGSSLTLGKITLPKSPLTHKSTWLPFLISTSSKTLRSNGAGDSLPPTERPSR